MRLQQMLLVVVLTAAGSAAAGELREAGLSVALLGSFAVALVAVALPAAARAWRAGRVSCGSCAVPIRNGWSALCYDCADENRRQRMSAELDTVRLLDEAYALMRPEGRRADLQWCERLDAWLREMQDRHAEG